MDDEPPVSTRWMAGFFACMAAFGLVMIVVALFQRSTVEPLAAGHVVAGRITRVDDDGCTIDGCRYTATIVFRAGARSYTTQTRMDYQQPKPMVGSTVQLSYDPADPARVRDLSLQHDDWQAYALTGGTLVLIGVASALLCVRSVRRQRGWQKPVRQEAPRPDWQGLLGQSGHSL